MDFRQAFRTLTAEFTAQPWDYTDADGATLTVIPAGLTAAPGDAEVYVRVTVDKVTAAEAGVTTTYLPALIDAIEQRVAWEHRSILHDRVQVTPHGDGLVILVESDDTPTVVPLPDQQRMPLASGLRRALDVARGWER